MTNGAIKKASLNHVEHHAKSNSNHTIDLTHSSLGHTDLHTKAISKHINNQTKSSLNHSTVHHVHNTHMREQQPVRRKR